MSNQCFQHLTVNHSDKFCGSFVWCSHRKHWKYMTFNAWNKPQEWEIRRAHDRLASFIGRLYSQIKVKGYTIYCFRWLSCTNLTFISQLRVHLVLAKGQIKFYLTILLLPIIFKLLSFNQYSSLSSWFIIFDQKLFIFVYMISSEWEMAISL